MLLVFNKGSDVQLFLQCLAANFTTDSALSTKVVKRACMDTLAVVGLGHANHRKQPPKCRYLFFARVTSRRFDCFIASHVVSSKYLHAVCVCSVGAPKAPKAHQGTQHTQDQPRWCCSQGSYCSLLLLFEIFCC